MRYSCLSYNTVFGDKNLISNQHGFSAVLFSCLGANSEGVGFHQECMRGQEIKNIFRTVSVMLYQEL